MSVMVVELRDVMMVVAAVAPSFAIYVGMRERMVKMETKIDTLTEAVAKQGTARETHSESLGGVRETQADHEARIKALEKHQDRPITGQFAALTADTTGPHKAPR